MFRSFLRKHPKLYSIVRNVHIKTDNIIKYHRRKKICYEYKKKIEVLSPNSKKIWYMCVPQHNNLGDYAQKLCIEDYLSKYFFDYQIIELPSSPISHDYCGFFDAFIKVVKEDDFIVFQSGYTSADLHDDEKVHRMVGKTFLHNKIVFFPQTVKYSSEVEARKTANIYNLHRRILFMARDKISFQTAESYFDNITVRLIPDIVTTLIGTQNYNLEREGILFCVRHDSEKKYSDNELKTRFKDICSPKDEWSDTTIECENGLSRELLETKLIQFAKHKVVVTDRFHGTIFSLITSTPVVVLSTSDHKVSEGADWFLPKYSEYLIKVKSIDEAFNACCCLLKKNLANIVEPYFQQNYYDKLVDLIREL